MAPYTSASSLSIISQTLYEPPVPVAVSGTFTPHTPSRATFVPPSVFQPETTHQCELIVELARREGKTVHVTDSGSDPNNVMVDVTGMSGQLILLTDKLDAVTECNIKQQCADGYILTGVVRQLQPLLIAQRPYGKPIQSLSVVDHDVYFKTPSGYGISLKDALGETKDLLHWDGLAFDIETSMSISTKAMIRFNPEGYPPYSRQVAVRRSTRTAEPITRGKLAKTVAQEIKTALGDRPELVVNGYPFSLDNIFLWRLHRVSKGSWQPDIYVLC